MRASLRLTCCSIAACFQLVAPTLWAQPNASIKVDENGLSASFQADGFSISVPVLNSHAAEIDVVLVLDLLDPDDVVLSTTRRTLTVPPGATRASALLPFPSSGTSANPSERRWWRVRYRISRQGNDPAVAGIVALGAIAPDLFVLQTVHARSWSSGVAYRVRVHALNPVTHEPVPGVQLRAALTRDADGRILEATAATDRQGEAALVWREVGGGETRADIVLTGRKIGQQEHTSLEVTFSLGQTIIASTDKQLYQPGQAVHARALLFDGQKHAVAGSSLRFTLKDPDGVELLRAAATTNSFGVASVDWRLPDQIRLGDYSLVTESESIHTDSRPTSNRLVRVGRYELPTFTVSVVPDRTYYLPDQDPTLAIEAKYLFGRAVSGGAIKVVRESERRWDYAKQTWIVDEQDRRDATLDTNGRGRVTTSLAAIRARVEQGEPQYYGDISYAIYVTDPSTGKTEERRVMVRVTRHPIHVYVSARRRAGTAVNFFVVAYYADGSPAIADVRVAEREKAGALRLLRTVSTNRFGAAKVTNLELRTTPEAMDAATIVLEVQDKAGRRGTFEAELRQYFEEESVGIRTDKTIYRPGEAVRVSVSARGSTHVGLEVVREGGTTWSTTVALKRGRGFSVIPYRERFRGLLTIVASPLNGLQRERVTTSRTVVYPSDTDLRVRIRPARRVYAPGDDFRAAIHVSAPNGTTSATALGVTMVDEAVDARARTDHQFDGGASGFWDWSWQYDPQQVGGLTLRDISRFDVSDEIPPEVDLAAEILLQGQQAQDSFESTGEDIESETGSRFRPWIESKMATVRRAIEAVAILPATDGELNRVLALRGLRLDQLLDPWGSRFAFRYGLDIRERTITGISAGPDKHLGTTDDLVVLWVAWNHFTPIGAVLDRVVRETPDQSGVYIRDLETLRAAMGRSGIDLDAVRDPWGQPYRFAFDVDGTFYRVLVQGAGAPDGSSPPSQYSVVWISVVDYFTRTRTALDKVCDRFYNETGHLPRSDAEMEGALRASAVPLRDMRDPWGHPYFVTYDRSTAYGDELRYTPNTAAQPVNAVTRTFDEVRIMSAGRDGERGTADDVQLAVTSQAVSAESAGDTVARPTRSAPVGEGVGSIEGDVTDATGAALSGATVQCSLEERAKVPRVAITDARGHYVISGLPAGSYHAQVMAIGFRTFTVRFVPVEHGRSTSLNVVLNVASVSETITVNAAAVVTQTSMAAVMQKDSEAHPLPLQPGRAYTPRVREYFPETLYWAPSIVTGPGGDATVAVTLADTLTTWKLGVIASTATGEIGFSEATVEAFQPFFVEYDPPKVLTAGDQIDLPMVVRNYLPAPQQAHMDLHSGSWLAPRGATSQTVSVAAGDVATVVFPFTAAGVTPAGHLKVIARAGATGDAVDKSVVVHADGEERHTTACSLFKDTARMTVSIPDDVIAGTATTTLRVYPHLLAHVIESVESGLVRPYGCGEQTVSAAYPSLLLLRHSRAAASASTPVMRRAESYVRDGIQRLLTLRTAEGGFGYWRPEEPDIALTAYAMRFLSDASDILPVDGQSVERAAVWLIERQEKDGSWRARYGDGETLTALVASALAEAGKRLHDGPLRTRIRESVSAAMPLVATARQPYSLGHLALAAWAMQLPQEAHAAVERLKASVRHEGTKAYWVLETNTPFYGWGLAGRVESTALAVDALQTVDGEASAPLVDAGMAFLLGAKDQYGVWYSGQATVDVLGALLRVLDRWTSTAEPSHVVVLVNGQPVQTLDLASGTDSGPVIRDLGSALVPGVNTIELRQTGGLAQLASVQVASRFTVPWTASSTARSAAATGASRGLRMRVTYDRPAAHVGDEVHARVEVERVGHKGYGMLLAEVGLPPGADVDRASLEGAVRSGGDVGRYEVQPDRVVFYVWPRAGGTTFTFAFRPRIALQAKGSASAVYDYYNPDEQAVVPPESFTVTRAKPAAVAGDRSLH